MTVLAWAEKNVMFVFPHSLWFPGMFREMVNVWKGLKQSGLWIHRSCVQTCLKMLLQQVSLCREKQYTNTEYTTVFVCSVVLNRSVKQQCTYRWGRGFNLFSYHFFFRRSWVSVSLCWMVLIPILQTLLEQESFTLRTLRLAASLDWSPTHKPR